MLNKEYKPQVFRCDCWDRSHYIEAVHYSWKDGFEEISLNFGVKWGDWLATQHQEPFENFFRKIKFRTKFAAQMIFKGYVEIEDSWIPARSEGELKLLGEKTLLELITWLTKALIKAKKNINNESKFNKRK